MLGGFWNFEGLRRAFTRVEAGLRVPRADKGVGASGGTKGQYSIDLGAPKKGGHQH